MDAGSSGHRSNQDTLVSRQGKGYYDILYFKYMDEAQNTEWDILTYTGMERSNYYRKRKEALTVLSQVLWGMAIPEVKSIIKRQQKGREAVESIA
jgi:hypothetical protein